MIAGLQNLRHGKLKLQVTVLRPNRQTGRTTGKLRPADSFENDGFTLRLIPVRPELTG